LEGKSAETEEHRLDVNKDIDSVEGKISSLKNWATEVKKTLRNGGCIRIPIR
jgi:hypothetical protein